MQGKNSLPPSVHAEACAVLDLDRLLLVGTDTVDSPPRVYLTTRRMLCSAKEKLDPVAETACIDDCCLQASIKTPTDKRRASVNITLWRFEASHTMRVRSAGPFCVKMFNSLQASKDQLFV